VLILLEHVLEAIGTENEDAIAGALRVVSRVTEHREREKILMVLCRRDYLSIILGHMLSSNKDIRVPAAVTAGNLCNQSMKCADFFYENGIIETTAKYQSEGWVDKVNACHIICGLVESLKEFCKKFWDSEAMPSVFEALKDKHVEVERAGVNVISCAIRKANIELITLVLKAGTLDPYFKLLLRKDEVMAIQIAEVILILWNADKEEYLLDYFNKLFTNEQIEGLFELPHREVINKMLVLLIDNRKDTLDEHIDILDTEKVKKAVIDEEIETYSQSVKSDPFSMGDCSRLCFSSQ